MQSVCGCALRLAGRAVRGPARVADADVAFQRLLVQLALKVGQLAHIAPDADASIAADHGDAGAVIAAIFQPPAALQR